VAERALVTGGAGFVGLHLCRRLLTEGYDVTALDNLSRHRADREFDQLREHVRFIDHDLALGVPERAPSGCALVAHLAAWVGVSRVSARPDRVLRDNIITTMSIVDWSVATGAETLFLSSTSEFGDGAAEIGVTAFPVGEQIPFVLARPHAARSSYALSKAVSEALLLHASGGPRMRIGRFYNVYGPRMGTAHVIPQFIERVLAGADPFPVYGGEHTRAFCHVSDAVEATMRLMRLPEEQPVLVNIGNDQQEISMTGLARELFGVAGYAAELDVREAPPGSPLRRLPDLTALRGRTGYQPSVSLADGLADTYAWYAEEAARCAS
jgi:UDP-glucuronate decarboxylase